MRRRPRRPKRDWPARQGAASAPHHTALLQGLFQQCANPPKISYRDPAGCLRASYSHPAAAIPLLCPVLYHCRGPLLLFVSPAPAFLLLSCAPYTRTPEKPSVLVACCLGRYRHCFPFWNRSFAAPRFPSFSPLYPAATRLLFFLRPRLRRIAPVDRGDAHSASSTTVGTGVAAVGPTALQAIASLGGSPGPQAEILRFPDARSGRRGKACAAYPSLRHFVFFFRRAFMLTRVSIFGRGGDLFVGCRSCNFFP